MIPETESCKNLKFFNLNFLQKLAECYAGIYFLPYNSNWLGYN